MIYHKGNDKNYYVAAVLARASPDQYGKEGCSLGRINHNNFT
jgi:hypothetical protein